MIDWTVEHLRTTLTPERQMRYAVVLFYCCIVGWPITSLSVLRDEPQGVLALSWLSLIISCVILVVTTEIHADE